MFPNRDYSARYLEGVEETRRFLDKSGAMLRIFVDEDMAETAMAFNLGNVYLVKDKPDFPFQQHIWRYYSVLFPNENIKAHHFRGLDNVSNDDLKMIDRFVETKLDVLHAPYISAKLKGALMPIRGSCSVSQKGIESLANFLKSKRPEKPNDPKNEFFNDEFFLREWYIKDSDKLDYFTFIDRVLPDSIYFSEIGLRMRSGHRIHIEGNIDLNGPMRSHKTKNCKLTKD